MHNYYVVKCINKCMHDTVNINQVSYDHRSYEHNLSNCVEKPEKVGTSTGFEPVTSRYQCDPLTN